MEERPLILQFDNDYYDAIAPSAVVKWILFDLLFLFFVIYFSNYRINSYYFKLLQDWIHSCSSFHESNGHLQRKQVNGQQGLQFVRWFLLQHPK
jgi:hypothetical protein